MKKFMYDFEIIDVDGNGTEANPYVPAIVNHSFLVIARWCLLPRGEGVEIDIIDGFDRIAQKYKDASFDTKQVGKENVKKMNDKIKEKKL